MEATYGFSFRNICLYSCMCLPYWIKMCLFLPASHKNILALLASIWRRMKELVHEVWRNRKFLPKVVLLSFWPPGPCSDTNETSLVYYLKLNTPILLEKAKKNLRKYFTGDKKLLWPWLYVSLMVNFHFKCLFISEQQVMLNMKP